MTPEKIKEILMDGEGIEVEFKTSKFELNKDAFESICAFLNRTGGHLILGVKNNGSIEGVLDNCLDDIIHNLVTNANNPQKLNPPFYLSTEVIELDGAKLIYVYVPASSQVHSTNGKIIDRNEDGDFDITGQSERVTQLYLRKQTTYSENRIFPYVKISDFKIELFDRIRVLAKNERSDHPWIGMDNEELLRFSGLYKMDHQTGKLGYTLAAILLLGRDELIHDIVPHYKTDAILRVENVDRYDDRDDIRTNLIESYDRLMSFIRKHLPDKYYQEGDQRISLRDRIFREIVGNLIIHREFTNAFPAKLIIENDKLFTENWNRPHDGGVIDPTNFSPFPKNPVIARFYKEIGRVDELGSGVRNTYKYCGFYIPGAKPEFIEDDVFKCIIPLKPEKEATPMTTQKTTQMTTQIISNKILELLKQDPKMSRRKLANVIGDITEDGIKYHLDKLKKEGKIKRVGGTRGEWEILDS